MNADTDTLLARFRDIVRHMDQGLFVYHLEDRADDRSLRLVACNPAAERITRATAGVLVGRTLDENFPTLRADGIPHAYAEVVRTGRPWRADFLPYADAGRRVAYSVRAFALPGDCVAVVFEDATEHSRALDDLRRSEARHRALVAALPDTLYRLDADGTLSDVRTGARAPPALERLVAQRAGPRFDPGEVRVFECQERAADLEVRVLRCGEEEVLAIVRDITERKRGDRRKDEFVSIVSHELRTPLTSIHGALGLIAGGVFGATPPALAELVDVARTNSDRLVRLINDMLDLDKMEAGQLELELVPLQVDALVDAALEGMGGAATNAGVRLARVTEEPGTVLGDRDRLLQVLTNLLSNAVRFSPPDASVVVIVRACGARVRILVKDEGPGVPADRVDHLFRKFAQLGAKRGGTGLGLAISKAIVDQHGGAVGLLPGGPGATFFVDLPAVQAPAAVEAPASVEDLFADLRVAYAASLPGQVSELCELVERLGADASVAPRIVTLAHRLHGSAGTYGFPAVSAAAGEVERLARGGPRDALVDAVAALRRAAG